MRDLIGFAYNIDTSGLREFDEIFYLDHGTSFTYIIPVGDEKSTTFFHLLKLIENSHQFQHIFTTDGAPTLLIRDVHYYCLHSTFKLHQLINQWQLNIPILYPAEYPLASHFKTKWLQKNQIHEQHLNLALDKTPPMMRSVLFDLATYYIHLNEEAYRLLKPFEQTPFSTSLCHARLKPETPLYQFFMPNYLILDNRSRIYCEYIRHLYLETRSLATIEHIIAHIVSTDPLDANEWQFLYARLYFPTHFYDLLYELITTNKVNLDELYDQTMNYSRLLAELPAIVNQYTGIILENPEWAKQDVKI